jgi:PKHD-type hydroxylase
MLILIENLIDEATVARLRGWLSEATFEDGRATAGGNAAKVKNNEQVSSDPNRPDPKLEEMQDLLEDLLWKHGFFMAAAQPKEIHPPLFSRYTLGMSYGTHMDNALMGDMRVDLALTLFLSDPADYDGGQLVIDFSTSFSTSERAIKLAAGSAVLYPATALHRVAEVTRGQRLAAVTWIRSLVRDAAKREILFDLRTAHHRLFKQLGKTAEVDLLSKAHTNLLRRWVED